MARFLKGTNIEIIRDTVKRGHLRHALFDFDGTVSLLREGWQQVMVPMMVESLMETPHAEGEDQIRAVVTEFVDRLTGRQTIYQMIQLAEEVEKRGGQPKDPLEYKRVYLDRLWGRIEGRVAGLKRGDISPEEMLLPGCAELLESLQQRGVTMYLASGTDIEYVQDEAQALGVTDYFVGGVYGAIDDYKKYSKRIIIERIIRHHNLHGREFAAFGDGFVEIENAKEVGGIAVGVASDEKKREGINEWKRRRLIDAGADLIIPEYRDHEKLVAYLFGEL